MLVVECTTRFDITATGVLGQYKENQALPKSLDGRPLHDRSAWQRARNQQRNWETFNQIISLRCLPENIRQPCCQQGLWVFDFDVESLAALSDQPDDLHFLISDAHGVPVITGLDENADIGSVIRTHGLDANTWFQVINGK